MRKYWLSGCRNTQKCLINQTKNIKISNHSKSSGTRETKELGLKSGEMVLTWYRSMRTTFGKVHPSLGLVPQITPHGAIGFWKTFWVFAFLKSPSGRGSVKKLCSLHRSQVLSQQEWSRHWWYIIYKSALATLKWYSAGAHSAWPCVKLTSIHRSQP